MKCVLTNKRKVSNLFPCPEQEWSYFCKSVWFYNRTVCVNIHQNVFIFDTVTVKKSRFEVFGARIEKQNLKIQNWVWYVSWVLLKHINIDCVNIWNSLFNYINFVSLSLRLDIVLLFSDNLINEQGILKKVVLNFRILLQKTKFLNWHERFLSVFLENIKLVSEPLSFGFAQYCAFISTIINKALQIWWD